MEFWDTANYQIVPVKNTIHVYLIKLSRLYKMNDSLHTLMTDLRLSVYVIS